MDLNKLKVFHAVAKFGGVSLASANLKMRSSSISVAISAFEEEIGCKLFQRHYRGMKLTVEGDRLYNSSKLIFEEFEFALNDLSKSESKLEEEIRISTSWGIASSDWFIAIIKKFLQTNPNIKIKIVDYSPQDLEEIQADVFICPYIYDKPEFIQKKIKTFCFKMFASKKYLKTNGTPESFNELDNHRLIAFTQELLNPFNTVDSILHKERDAQDPRNISIEVNSSVCLLKLIKNNMGIGVISIEAEIKSELIEVLAEQAFSNSVYVSYRKKNKDSKHIKRFEDVC